MKLAIMYNLRCENLFCKQICSVNFCCYHRLQCLCLHVPYRVVMQHFSAGFPDWSWGLCRGYCKQLFHPFCNHNLIHFTARHSPAKEATASHRILRRQPLKKMAIRKPKLESNPRLRNCDCSDDQTWRPRRGLKRMQNHQKLGPFHWRICSSHQRHHDQFSRWTNVVRPKGLSAHQMRSRPKMTCRQTNHSKFNHKAAASWRFKTNLGLFQGVFFLPPPRNLRGRWIGDEEAEKPAAKLLVDGFVSRHL